MKVKNKKKKKKNPQNLQKEGQTETLTVSGLYYINQYKM